MSNVRKWQMTATIVNWQQMSANVHWTKRQNSSNVTVRLQWLGVVKTTLNSCSQCQMSANGGWQLLMHKMVANYVERISAATQCAIQTGGTNQQNAGWTSVDRSTKATLSTYNTWIQISRLQKIYLFHCLKKFLVTKLLAAVVARLQQSRDLMLGM